MGYLPGSCSEGRVFLVRGPCNPEDGFPGLFDECSFPVFGRDHVAVDEVLDEVVVEVGFGDVVVGELQCSFH